MIIFMLIFIIITQIIILLLLSSKYPYEPGILIGDEYYEKFTFAIPRIVRQNEIVAQLIDMNILFYSNKDRKYILNSTKIN